MDVSGDMRKEWVSPRLETLEVKETRAPGDQGNACDHSGAGIPPFCS